MSLPVPPRDQGFQPQVWTCSLTAWESSAPQALTWLDDRERERLRRFKHEDAARRFLLARAMLKSAVAALEQITPESVRLNYTANGKPFLSGRDRPHFSISHSISTVAVALAPFDLGVDVELIQRRTQPWARPQAFLHADEAARVAARPSTVEQAMAFTRRWSCQEAAVKLLDSSIFNTGDRVRFGHALEEGLCGERQVHFASWLLDSGADLVQPLPPTDVTRTDVLPADALVLSLAATQPLPMMEFRRWQGSSGGTV